jgi:hypothetical protein
VYCFFGCDNLRMHLFARFRPPPTHAAAYPQSALPPRFLLARGFFVLDLFSFVRYRPAMPDPDERLTPADPSDIADSIAFALQFSGRKRVHDSDTYMAAIVANRIVRHLERAGFVVMKRPPAPGGGGNPGRTGTPRL